MRAIAPLLVLLLAATATADAEPLPLPKVGTCPSGYSSSSAYCTPVSSQSPRAIVKAGGPCPSGCADSGRYCTEVRPPR
jgi:hypothetical protein